MSFHNFLILLGVYDDIDESNDPLWSKLKCKSPIESILPVEALNWSIDEIKMNTEGKGIYILKLAQRKALLASTGA